MRRSVLLASVVPLFAHAQTVTQADMPSDGMSFVFGLATYVDLPATGEGQTWDLSTVTPVSTSTLDCVLPSATSYADDFPMSTIALLDDDIQQFLRIDASGMYMNGMWNGNIPALITYTNEYQVLGFPCSYGTTLSDTFAGGYNYQGDPVAINGTVSGTVNGTGTLILPSGPVTNVLKMTVVEESHEVLDTDDYGLYSDVVYFFKPGVNWFLMKSISTVLTVNDEPTNSFAFLNYLAQPGVGVEEMRRNDIGLDAFPVPAHDRLTVTYALDGAHATTLELRDAAGRVVRTTGEVRSAAGLQRTELEVAGLPAGIYMLSITDDRGQRGTRKVVLE